MRWTLLYWACELEGGKGHKENYFACIDASIQSVTVYAVLMVRIFQWNEAKRTDSLNTFGHVLRPIEKLCTVESTHRPFDELLYRLAWCLDCECGAVQTVNCRVSTIRFLFPLDFNSMHNNTVVSRIDYWRRRRPSLVDSDCKTWKME